MLKNCLYLFDLTHFRPQEQTQANFFLEFLEELKAIKITFDIFQPLKRKSLAHNFVIFLMITLNTGNDHFQLFYHQFSRLQIQYAVKLLMGVHFRTCILADFFPKGPSHQYNGVKQFSKSHFPLPLAFQSFHEISR